MSLQNEVIVLHNIISPYKTLLFNEIYKLNKDIRILYICETENRREWTISKNDLEFPYEIMFDKALDEINFLRLLKTTFQRLNSIRPRLLIIDGYLYASSWAGLLWAKLNNRKVLLWSSSNEVDHSRIFYKELLKKLFIKGCSAFNVYGTKSRDYLAGLGANEEWIFLVGNNTDNDFYFRETMSWRKDRDELRRSLGVAEKNFLFIGRFSKEKNIATLLNAYRMLAGKASTEWGLVLLGSGPQLSEIREYIAGCGIGNVVLPGFRQQDEIPRYFAVSDVFVLPSTSEPWGLVVNEAMAAGLPTLVSRKCGCYPDIVKDGVTGFSFDPHDQQELRRLMQGIVDGEVDLDRMGRNALDVISAYTPKRAAGVVVNTLELVSGGA